MDCYSCKYHKNIPGDTHIECEHPMAQAHKMTALLALLNTNKRYIEDIYACLGIKIDAAAYGSGYAMYPINFDPIWINNCDGYDNIKP